MYFIHPPINRDKDHLSIAVKVIALTHQPSLVRSQWIHPSMAAKPRKKKLNNVSMSSSASTRFRYKKVSVFVSLVMIFGVVYLLGVSSSIWSGVGFVPKLYAIQVFNEFPHDPSAFTQVNPFLGFLCFCLIWLYCL